MSRRVSLLILLGTVIAIGVLFYQVVRPFLFSLLFAAVLAVLFGPGYNWRCKRAADIGASRLGSRPPPSS